MPCSHRHTNIDASPKGMTITCTECGNLIEYHRSGTPDEVDQAWNPGGWQAKKKGCTCPRLDNHEGTGRSMAHAFQTTPDNYIHIQGKVYFIVAKDCELHADTSYHDPTSRPNDS